MDKKSLEAKLVKAEEQFKTHQEEERKLLEDAKVLNQNLAKVREEMVRVQGDYRTIQGLIDEIEPTTGETPEKKLK